MAIVLEVTLTLNPVNQIAYLADFTSLVDGVEYVISATYLQNDTRFTFHGNFDITLTKPPIGVPGPNTPVLATISTVPLAATPPPPVTYPFSTKDRLDASNLNNTFEFSPGPTPPHSALGGAGMYKYWVDTSTSPATMRQCIVARASVTYVASEWTTIGTVDGTGFILTGYLPLTGGTLTGQFNIQPATGWSGVNLYCSGSGQAAYIQSLNGGKLRWGLYIGNTAPETGGNAGSDFVIGRYADDGSNIGTVLTINRATGVTGLAQLALSTPLPVASGGTGTSSGAAGPYLPLTGGTVNGNMSVAGSIGVTGNVGGGTAIITGNLSASSLTTGGTLTAASATITGSTINLNGQPVLFANTPHSSNYTILYGNDGNGGLFLGGNTSYLRQGNQYFQAQDTTNYALFMSIGTFNQSGAWGSLSDRRLKQDIEPYTRGLDAILALNPVRFRYRPGTPFAVKDEAGADRPSEPLIGLIADEVMPHLPELVGSDGEYQTLHPGNLVYALIGACRELAARVKKLEEGAT